MPISQLSSGLQKVIKFFPGTYATSLVRNHSMRGVFAEMERLNYPQEIIKAFEDMTDCNLYFNGKLVGQQTMFIILGATVVVAVGIYVALNLLSFKERK